MGINLGNPNTTRWYSGTLSGKTPITGDFTAVAVVTSVVTTISKHQYWLSIGALGVANSLNLLTPNKGTLGRVRIQTQTSGQSIETVLPMTATKSYLVIGRRTSGFLQCGFIDITNKTITLSPSTANSDTIAQGAMIVGELTGSQGTRGVLGGMSIAGIYTKAFTDKELLDIASGAIPWSDYAADEWEVFRFASATPTVTGTKGTVLTRVGSAWGDSYDPIPWIPAPLDTPIDAPLANMPIHKDALDSAKVVTEVYASGSRRNAYTRWIAPPMPPARGLEIPGGLINVSNAKTHHYMALWDALVDQSEGYITKSVLGRDQSNTYDIHLLDFKPKSYSNTLIVFGGTHGSEAYGSYLLYLFFNEVVNKYKNSRHLIKMRNDTRVLLIPLVNPWGAAQEPTNRQNSRAVDINRNWDYRWAEYVVANPDHDAKGSAPWSEAETIICRDLILAHPEAKALIDCHFLGSGGGGPHFTLFTGSEFDSDGGVCYQSHQSYKRDGWGVDRSSNGLQPISFHLGFHQRYVRYLS